MGECVGNMDIQVEEVSVQKRKVEEVKEMMVGEERFQRNVRF